MSTNSLIDFTYYKMNVTQPAHWRSHSALTCEHGDNLRGRAPEHANDPLLVHGASERSERLGSEKQARATLYQRLMRNGRFSPGSKGGWDSTERL